MNCLDFCPTEFMWFIPLIIVLFIWDAVLKLLAMWKAAQRKELLWFVLIAIINTIGILPLIYLIVNKDKKEE
ncbi:MAG: DUF5652 family protein [Paludibacter sp.]|nr:DUF5652 family protein [Paludibacter sp.]